MKKKRLLVFMAAMGIAAGLASSAWADTLTWNGARGALWNATDANWLDAGNNSVAWQDGAAAVIPAGESVTIPFKVTDPGYVFNYTMSSGECQVRLLSPGGKVPDRKKFCGQDFCRE